MGTSPRMTLPWALVSAQSRSAESSPCLSCGLHGLGQKVSNPLEEGSLGPGPSLFLNRLKSGLKGPLAKGLEISLLSCEDGDAFRSLVSALGCG